MTPEQKARMDQATAVFNDYMPTQWRQLYLRLVEEGFSEQQAFELLKTYITTSCRLLPD